MIPRATYRFQFHKDFTFAEAARLADYLDRLGVSHVYASPILTARAGSPHGYDVIDPSRINPELGGEEGFREMAARLRERGIGIIADIVPNHMAVGGGDNPWWLDVLEKGSASPYAGYFDIDWQAPGLEGKILAPFLGTSFEEAAKSEDLKLLCENGKIVFAYWDHRFPLRPEDQEELVGADPAALSLEDLHSRQHFALTDWREADNRINWRRFFDITSLAALNMDRDEVFEAVHAKIFTLYAEGLLDGLRIDHVDGLADPRAYCRKLRASLGELRPDPAYIVVEKILAADEVLPLDWQVDGTTGYDFMNEVSALQHGMDPDGVLDALWSRYGKRPTDFEEEERRARREILATKFQGQLTAAARAFAETDRVLDLEAVVTEMRCYRSYATGQPDSPGLGSHVSAAITKAATAYPGAEVIGEILEDKTGNPGRMGAIRRFNQLSAPVAAKAVEDTAFYRYGRLLSRNDVGFDPRQRSLDVAEFHRLMSRRAATFPTAMLATATHDHKRGEDARARLAVLSGIPQFWQATVEEWFRLNAPSSIDSADEYQLYQTLVGAWPDGGTTSPDFPELAGRIEAWCLKYLREAKLRSSWQAPDEGYEARMLGFAKDLLEGPGRGDFRRGMAEFIARVEPAARANSLVQCALHFTVPGVPDLYQGCEFQDFSMVDPDNRRPVDFTTRQRWDEKHIKQRLIASLLQLRREHTDLFLKGDYRPLAVSGERKDHIVAFERRYGDERLWVLALRNCASALFGTAQLSPSCAWWGETTIDLPGEIFVESRKARDLLGDFPVFVGRLSKGVLSTLALTGPAP